MRISAENSQAGQASVITDQIIALWRISLMLELNYSLLNKRINILECLGFDNFYMQSPGNHHAEDYIEVIYMIHKGALLSVQCEMDLRWSKSMREVDGPSFSSLILVFQPLHHVSIEFRPRCSFLRT
jgi:hypothetical protein